jgi:hypothetical protein
VGISRKDEITVTVVTTSQLSFIPFTPVPDSWRGRQVRLVVMPAEQGELPAFTLGMDAE